MAEETGSSPLRPIVVVRKKVAGHGGHHGGAWKVAYADFVTAMMALFIVLWLLGADKETKEAIVAYFNDPSGPGKLTGTAAAGQGNSISIPLDDMKKLREKIEQALMTVPDFRRLKDHVEITITSDGLRIELLETEAGMFFESGKPVPSAMGSELLSALAGELGKMANGVFIEGHTDARPFGTGGTYSNWELSTDRANSARRLMEANGLKPSQIGQVRGYSDRQLRHPEDPNNASNRRISVIVQYLTPPSPSGSDPEAKEESAEKPGHKSEEKQHPEEKKHSEEKKH